MAEETTSVSLVTFDDDTGILEISTAAVSAEEAGKLYKEFLDQGKSYQIAHPWGTLGDLTPLIRIDARSGNGLSNIVVELQGAASRNYYDFKGNLVPAVQGGTYVIGHMDDTVITPLNNEGLGHVIYSSESGRETYRRTGANPGHSAYERANFHFDGHQDVKPPEPLPANFNWEEFRASKPLGRLAPKVSAADVTQLLKSVGRVGRAAIGYSTGYTYQPTPLTQEIYDVDKFGSKNGTSPYKKEDMAERYALRHRKAPAHIKCLLLPTEQLTAAFPFLKDIAPTTAEETPDAPNRAAPKAKAPEFAR